jgi:hypothetical protein
MDQALKKQGLAYHGIVIPSEMFGIRGIALRQKGVLINP